MKPSVRREVRAGVSPIESTSASSRRWGDLSLPVPSVERAVVVVPAPGEGPGYWAGAPSAVFFQGVFYLAYRLRRPEGQGRGYAMVVARSHDGWAFDTIAAFQKEQFASDSLERPALVRTPSGHWRLYASCATPGTLHWRVELLEADDPGSFDPKTRRVVLPGDGRTAVKDPFVAWSEDRWHLWASCHPLPDPAEADRMVTGYASSLDGLAWSWGPTALAGRPGMWDERGARLASVIRVGDRTFAYYDGRATAAENGDERTGLAIGTGGGVFEALDDTPLATSPYRPGSLRYVNMVSPGDGTHRLYYEATNPDGAHSLYTERVRLTDATNI